MKDSQGAQFVGINTTSLSFPKLCKNGKTAQQVRNVINGINNE